MLSVLLFLFLEIKSINRPSTALTKLLLSVGSAMGELAGGGIADEFLSAVCLVKAAFIFAVPRSQTDPVGRSLVQTELVCCVTVLEEALCVVFVVGARAGAVSGLEFRAGITQGAMGADDVVQMGAVVDLTD